MRLLHLRSSWGLRALSANPRAVLHGVRLSGWRGLEASLADLGTTHAERKATVAEAHAAELPLILSAYSSWPNYEGPCDSSRSVREHAAQFGAELCEIAELAAPPGGDAGSPTVLRVNGHSGSDAWTEAEALDYFGEVQHVAASLGASLPPLSHETHRGRYLCCPFATARLLRRAPELRLTSDFSHWVVKCERLLETRPELELLAEIAPAVDHLHARIGTAQAAQVGSVHSPSTRHAAERFYSWWEAVWEARAQAGDELVTATLEYGPAEWGEGGEYLGYPPEWYDGLPADAEAEAEELRRAGHSERDERDERRHAQLIDEARRALDGRYGRWLLQRGERGAAEGGGGG